MDQVLGTQYNFILVSEDSALHSLLPHHISWTEISFQIVQPMLHTFRSIYKMELPEIIMVINIQSYKKED